MEFDFDGKFDMLRKLDVNLYFKMSPVLFLDRGTIFQTSKLVVLIALLQNVVLT